MNNMETLMIGVDQFNELYLLFVPLIAAIGAALREIVELVRGHKLDSSQRLKSDMEVGKSLRDELLSEIERQDKKIAKSEADCTVRLEAMEARLKVVQKDADAAREDAKSLRITLDGAEKVIKALNAQVVHLNEFARSQGDVQ